MTCPLCGCKVTYQGLNTLECSGSALSIGVRTGDFQAENCPNYRPAPTVWDTAPDLEPLHFDGAFGLFTMTGVQPAKVAPSNGWLGASAGLAVGSRAWAISMHAQGAKLEVRYVPMANANPNIKVSAWLPVTYGPGDPNFNDYPPFTTEWRLKP